jgi:hypothetical protein
VLSFGNGKLEVWRFQHHASTAKIPIVRLVDRKQAEVNTAWGDNAYV